MLHALVNKIVVHATDRSTGYRRQQIDIYYNFVEKFDLSHEVVTRPDCKKRRDMPRIPRHFFLIQPFFTSSELVPSLFFALLSFYMCSDYFKAYSDCKQSLRKQQKKGYPRIQIFQIEGVQAVEGN